MKTISSLKKKVSLVLPNLEGGGAERISVNLANALVERNYEVEMVLLSASGPFLSDLVPGVRVVDLRVTRFRSALMPLIRYIRDSKPTAMLACMWPLTVLAVVARSLSNVPMRLLLAEHNTWSVSQRDHRSWIRPLIRWSMRLCFPHADGIIAVSKGAAADQARFANLDGGLITTIYNPVVDPRRHESRGLDQKTAELLWPKAKYRIISAGNLKPQKNQALILRAIKLLSQQLDVHLIILGEGKLRATLEQQAKELDITDRVTLAGFKAQPYPYLQSANLFTLSSDWEGLPTVLIEALAAGTPIVSTDCPSGPSEILANGRFGRLVPVGDAAALAEAMAQSLTSIHDHDALKARAQDFSIDKAVDEYVQMLFPTSSGERAA